MQSDIRSKADKFAAWCSGAGSWVVCVLTLVIMACLTATAFFTTTDVDLNNACAENIVFYRDNVIAGVVTCAASIIFLFLFRNIIKKVPLWVFTTVMTVCTVVFGFIFVSSAQSIPVNDSYSVCQAAYCASIGDWSFFEEPYFFWYPFQLGYVLFCEIIIRIFGTGNNFLVMQYVNVLCLAVSYLSAIGICRRISSKSEVPKLAATMMLFCMPTVFFCTFTYGNIPGLMFVMLSFWMFYEFKERKKLVFGILSALFIGIAISIKMNYTIAFVALAIIWLIWLLGERNLKSAICLLLVIVSALSIKNAAITSYEKRSAIDFGDGIPMASWAAMGLNEAYNGPGWYNGGHTVSNYEKSGRDAEVAAENSVETIKNRLSYFVRNPGEAVNFFARKFASQWNEPSYQSIWNIQVRGAYSERGRMAEYVIGDGEKPLKSVMNYEFNILLVGVLAGLVYLLKKKDVTAVLLPTFLLGSVMYHMIFEAKAQYSLVFLVVMLPLAALGLEYIFCKADQLIDNHVKKKSQKGGENA